MPGESGVTKVLNQLESHQGAAKKVEAAKVVTALPLRKPRHAVSAATHKGLEKGLKAVNELQQKVSQAATREAATDQPSPAPEVAQEEST